RTLNESLMKKAPRGKFDRTKVVRKRIVELPEEQHKKVVQQEKLADDDRREIKPQKSKTRLLTSHQITGYRRACGSGLSRVHSLTGRLNEIIVEFPTNSI